MREQRRKWNVRGGVAAAVLLMSLAVGVIVALAIGLLVSFLALRGASLSIIGLGVPAGLFLGSLLGGVFACAKMKGMPLLWGVCVAAELSIVCFVAGTLMYGAADLMEIAKRCVAALAGGAAAGVISALARK